MYFIAIYKTPSYENFGTKIKYERSGVYVSKTQLERCNDFRMKNIVKIIEADTIKKLHAIANEEILSLKAKRTSVNEGEGKI